MAEVLITLGIIGVVAALTLPAVISNTGKRENVAKLKKAYSTLLNAKMMMETNDEECDGGRLDCSEAYSKYIKNTKVIPRWSDESEYDEFRFTPERSGFTSWADLSSGPGLIQGIDGNTYFWDCAGVVVDVNGPHKGPNKAGVDLFLFVYCDNTYCFVYPTAQHSRLLPAGKDIYRSETDCDSEHVSEMCTEYVIVNGNMDYLK